jgi:hypothetical protein
MRCIFCFDNTSTYLKHKNNNKCKTFSCIDCVSIYNKNTCPCCSQPLFIKTFASYHFVLVDKLLNKFWLIILFNSLFVQFIFLTKYKFNIIRDEYFTICFNIMLFYIFGSTKRVVDYYIKDDINKTNLCAGFLQYNLLIGSHLFNFSYECYLLNYYLFTSVIYYTYTYGIDKDYITQFVVSYE